MRVKVEPGAWVRDMYVAKDRIERPEPLPRDRLLDSGEVRDDYIAYEGLGFCVFEYIPVDMLEDAKLRKLWLTTKSAMAEIVKYLEKVPRSKHIRKEVKRKRLIKKVKPSKSRVTIPTDNEPFDINSIGEEIGES